MNFILHQIITSIGAIAIMFGIYVIINESRIKLTKLLSENENARKIAQIIIAFFVVYCILYTIGYYANNPSMLGIFYYWG